MDKQPEYMIPKSIPFFAVSKNGEVIAADTGKKVAIRDNGHGYKQVQIMRSGKRYTRYVHRLVAECFLEKPDGYDYINHKDGNKSNNSVSNLEWCTQSQNLLHAYKNELRPRTTDKQRAAARKSAALNRESLREGWKRWAKTGEARKCWIKNIQKADRRHKKSA